MDEASGSGLARARAPAGGAAAPQAAAPGHEPPPPLLVLSGHAASLTPY